MLGAYLKSVCGMPSIVLSQLKSPLTQKRTHKDTTPQYLRTLIYKKNVEIYEIK